MTDAARSVQEILSEQFALTAQLSALTGDYHRALQKVSAAGFARQLAEQMGDDEGHVTAAADEDRAHAAAELVDAEVRELELKLNALARELSALKEKK